MTAQNVHLHSCGFMSSSCYLCGSGLCVCVCLCLGPSLNFLSCLWLVLSVWQQVRQWSQQQSYSMLWLEVVGSNTSLLPSTGQVVVRTGGVGECLRRWSRWFKLPRSTLIVSASHTLMTVSWLYNPRYRCAHAHPHAFLTDMNDIGQTK